MKINNFSSNYLVGTRKERGEFLKGIYKNEIDDCDNIIKKYKSFKSPLLGGYMPAVSKIRDNDRENIKKYFSELKYDEAGWEVERRETDAGFFEGIGMGLSLAASVVFPVFFIPAGFLAADFILRGRNILKYRKKGFGPGIIGHLRGLPEQKK